MTPYYSDDWLTVYHGDSRAVMAELPAESVHMVCTSPPYWGLRDYGTASWTGGDDGCVHAAPPRQPRNDRPLGAFHGGSDDGNASREPDTRHACGKCGATRVDDQLGLEATPEAYVANLVAVFREVRRVLRSDGTVWLNLGDSYAGDNAQGRAGSKVSGLRAAQYDTVYGKHGGDRDKNYGDDPRLKSTTGRLKGTTGLKPKDLVGIPWRVAFALQADGWYLRSDIIWAKPNPMPESVTDRPTKAHEYLFLLAKSPRYYFDADAVREADSGQDAGNGFAGRQGGERQTAVNGGEGSTERWRAARGRVPAGWDTAEGGHVTTRNNGRMPGPVEYRDIRGGRNIRSVWSIATAPYPGAHFATFPPKLVEPCIKAGTSERGVCPECGAPWQRIVERSGELDESRPQARRALELVAQHGLTDAHIAAVRSVGVTDAGKARTTQNGTGRNKVAVQALADEAKAALGGYYRELLLDRGATTGWRPTCDHYARAAEWPDVPTKRIGESDDHYSKRIAPVIDLRRELVAFYAPFPSVPASVLDPFAGSGTTGMVAQSLSRRAVLIDLSMDYLGQLMDRNRDIPLGLGA